MMSWSSIRVPFVDPEIGDPKPPAVDLEREVTARHGRIHELQVRRRSLAHEHAQRLAAVHRELAADIEAFDHHEPKAHRSERGIGRGQGRRLGDLFL